MTTQQIALNLKLKDDTTLANYYGESNIQLLMHLQIVAKGRGERFTYLWGPCGVGKTHLLQACCHASNQLGLTTLYLPLGSCDRLSTSILDGLEALHLVCVDDIQAISGKAEWEESFFDFFNRMKEARKRLIISSLTPPLNLKIKLPDLLSRLTCGTVFQVYSLTEEQKIDALILRAKANGLELSLAVAQFLIRRLDRDLGSLFRALEKLDKASLAAQRKLTIPFVKSVLGL